jgi:hypothetical protein
LRELEKVIERVGERGGDKLSSLDSADSQRTAHFLSLEIHLFSSRASQLRGLEFLVFVLVAVATNPCESSELHFR